MTSVEETGRWRRICREDDLAAAGRMEAALGRGAVLLLWLDGGPVACAAHCPHAMAPLIDGVVKDGRLHCARHLASFHLVTGAPEPTWKIPPLALYPARARDGWIEVEAPAA